ncbi:uncharacterized protein AMSG_01600 [Thecamonas trahens ATCC 50062]|uniref:Uncharacterized protein n=1 Tax=Thecamonas trahens ATCC 50062 TaxID=461836 RepID=A0A0L0DR12_THETB|nr:hypothetical protein AMSG_01600 [Thecamonas trahens ATCC 50062]KNC54749.1 hypothetical protein AMSG_01600 [Thecamonas trahens ATCC 50062]|eukprot:XP_013761649.1 hypothetical protein AMSG_01600 [Thecamonas trahens ATCC 50062]
MHVFVIQSDVTKVAASAFLLPTDFKLRIEPYWPEWTHPESGFTVPDAYRSGDVRVLRGPAPQGRTPVYYVAVGTDRLSHMTDDATGRLAYVLESLGQFVARAAADLPATPPHRRAKHLLALPVVGTGKGGLSQSTGEVIGALLPALRALAELHGVDIVLVAHTRPMYAAIQAYRRRHPRPESIWSELAHKAQFRSAASALVAEIRAKRLVLFLGAGVSAGAGLPLWGDLLSELARVAGVEPDALWSLSSFLDQAAVLEDRLNETDPDALGSIIADQLASHVFSLLHALLASLDTPAAVTTNYDTLYEDARAAASRPVAVLPNELDPDKSEWLLKMHGCVTKPDSIVLSREHYNAYAESRSVLAGILQTQLMTKRMLFVGFGLTDDNFHKIVSAVRASCVNPSARTPGAASQAAFGIASVLFDKPMLTELWSGELDILPMVTQDTDATLADAARMLEMFIDYVGAEAATSGGYLLADPFECLLSQEDVKLARHVRTHLTRIFAHGPSDDPTYGKLVAFASQLGTSVDELASASGDKREKAGSSSGSSGGSRSNGNCDRSSVIATVPPPAPLIRSPWTDNMSNGHVFVLHSDIMELDCDSWLLPAWLSEMNTVMRWNKFWFPTGPRDIPISHARKNMSTPLVSLPGMGEERPVPWATDISGKSFGISGSAASKARIRYLKNSVISFLDAAAEFHLGADAERPTPLQGRERHLVAFPVSGNILHALVPAAFGAAARHGIDVAIVCFESPEMFAAAIAIRAAFVADPRAQALLDPPLSGDMKARIEKLSADIAADRTVLVVAEADSAPRAVILDEAVATLELQTDEVAAFASLPLTDQVRVLLSRLEAKGVTAPRKHIVKRLETELHRGGIPLLTALVANLGVRQVISTEWHCMLEAAARSAQRELLHLPARTTSRRGQRTIIKLFGDVRHSDNLPLEQRGLSRGDSTRMAMASATLATSRVLAVSSGRAAAVPGELMSAVKRSVQLQSFGTLITSDPNPFLSEAWPELDVIPVASPRALAIVFDELLSCVEARNTRHVLQHKFQEARTEYQKLIASDLASLANTTEKMRDSSAYYLVHELLVDLGFASARADIDARRPRPRLFGCNAADTTLHPSARAAFSSALQEIESGASPLKPSKSSSAKSSAKSAPASMTGGLAQDNCICSVRSAGAPA